MSATLITCWGSLLWLSTTACTDRSSRVAVADPAQAAVVIATTEDGRTRFEIRSGVKLLRSITVDRDSTVPSDAAPVKASILGEIPGVAVVIVDSYASKPGGMSYCQAGEEQFLRVVALSALQPGEKSKTKIASCRDNIELAQKGVEWRADSSLVRIHWLTGPTRGVANETRSIRIGQNAAVEVMKP